MNTDSLSASAIISRINHVLAHRNEKLCKCSENSHDWHKLGDYFIIDTKTNAVIGDHIDIEYFAKTIGVMRQSECLEQQADHLSHAAI